MEPPKDKTLLLMRDGNVFAVRGYATGDEIDVALKYYPSDSDDPGGSFVFRDRRYAWNRKPLDLGFLEEHPQYYSPGSTTLLAANLSQVSEIFDPFAGYQRIAKKASKDEMEATLIEVGDILESHGINEASLGVTGTVLLGTHSNEYSDIDLVVGGSGNFRIAREAIGKDGRFSDLLEEEWRRYFERYGIGERYSTDFGQFLIAARGKGDRAKFRDRGISVFNVRNDDERRPREKVISLWDVEVAGRITSDDESSFYPARYDVEVHRSTAPEHAVREVVAIGREYYLEGRPGDAFMCSGRLQLVVPEQGEKHFRVEVGYVGGDLKPHGTLKIAQDGFP